MCMFVCLFEDCDEFDSMATQSYADDAAGSSAGTAGSSGNGGPATSALLNAPRSVYRHPTLNQVLVPEYVSPNVRLFVLHCMRRLPPGSLPAVPRTVRSASSCFRRLRNRLPHRNPQRRLGRRPWAALLPRRQSLALLWRRAVP